MKPRYPWTLERRYERALLVYVAHVHAATLLAVDGLERRHADGFWSDVWGALEAVRRRFVGPTAASVEAHGVAVAQWAVAHNPTIVMPSTPSPLHRASYDVPVFPEVPPELMAEFGAPARVRVPVTASPRAAARQITKSTVDVWVRENVALVTSIETKYFDDLSSLIRDAAQKGMRNEKLARLIEDRYGVLQSSARRIARDQIGKLSGEISRQRQIAAGFTTYVWQSVEDQRVRDLHEHLNGKVMRWDTPHITEGFPGWPIQCRCVALPHGRD